MDIIKVDNLKKNYVAYERGEGFTEALMSLFKRKKKVYNALKGISFKVEKGEIAGFLGPNGAGKSTTLKILSGILHPDSGTVDVMGFNPALDRKEYVRNIGAVFGQKSQLFWDLPPIDAFHFQKTIYGMEDKEFGEHLEKLTAMLQIRTIAKRPTRQLSLGERMRCEFVMAMLHKPKVVFLDEPTIGLDIFAKETIRNFIKKINNEEKITFIVTSHDLEDIENLCSKVIIINNGKIVFDDVVSRLKFGKKKIIAVTYHDNIDFTKLKSLKNVVLVKKLSPSSVVLEVDTTGIYLDEAIRKIRMGQRILDLDIMGPPIKDIIKRLYAKDEEPKH